VGTIDRRICHEGLQSYRYEAVDVQDPATHQHDTDVLVSNAGICPFHEFLSMPHGIWERTRAVNLDGSFYIVQAVANVMKMQTPQGGAIIGISSISALVGGAQQV
jgi:NAD(P)-dependent dehydrogenase (short-subunit alcohol dehydrogenase family)